MSWALDVATGRLTISGTGPMADYSDSGSNRSPFYEIHPMITSVVIDEGVTSIGNYAFGSCGFITSVTIPGSVTSIGEGAFKYTGMTSVTIPDGVTSIGKGAFYWCQAMTSVTIPTSVTSIGGEAFIYCSGLTSVPKDSPCTVSPVLRRRIMLQRSTTLSAFPHLATA